MALRSDNSKGLSQGQMDKLDRRVRRLREKKVPRSCWTNAEIWYEAYEISGNVMGSGADLPPGEPS